MGNYIVELIMKGKTIDFALFYFYAMVCDVMLGVSNRHNADVNPLILTFLVCLNIKKQKRKCRTKWF